LIWAAQNGYLDTVKLLLEKGADPKILSPNKILQLKDKGVVIPTK